MSRSSSPTDAELSTAALDALVERVVSRVQQQSFQQQAQFSKVPPAPVVRGIWQDSTSLHHLMEAGAVRVGTNGTTASDPGRLARYIDHTLLKPTATRADIVKVCEEARAHGFASVCINSTWVGLVARLLDGSRVLTVCVVGFPLGAMVTAAKAAETRQAITDGAQEIDMVIDLGALKGGDHDRVFDDISDIVAAAAGRPVKVILETSMLTRDEKIVGCAISKAAGASFVKTSTGFGGGGATAADIALMRAVVGPDMGVKASGGVRTAADARAMIAAGATRLGASASVAIVTGGAGKGGY